MKITGVGKRVVEDGLLGGAVSLVVEVVDKESKSAREISVDELFSALLDISKIKLVEITGKLSVEAEIKTILSGLAAKNKKVTFITSGDEDLSLLGFQRNLRIVLEAKVPNKKENSLKATNLGLLREDDELRFSLKNLEDYSNLKVYLKDKLITRPVVFFSAIDMDDQEEFLEEYLNDSENFTFRNRVLL